VGTVDCQIFKRMVYPGSTSYAPATPPPGGLGVTAADAALDAGGLGPAV
jgi:hypothetical protein